MIVYALVGASYGRTEQWLNRRSDSREIPGVVARKGISGCVRLGANHSQGYVAYALLPYYSPSHSPRLLGRTGWVGRVRASDGRELTCLSVRPAGLCPPAQ